MSYREPGLKAEVRLSRDPENLCFADFDIIRRTFETVANVLEVKDFSRIVAGR